MFSGPFKLLADLILEQRVDVCDVPVGRITEAFLKGGLAGLDAWSLEEATWFVAICAVLLELKVGRLLPRPVVQTEEDLLGGASPDLTYARSLELAAFRRLADVLAKRMADASLMVPRTAGPPPEFQHLYPDPLGTVTAENLTQVAAALLRPPAPLDLSHVTPIRATLAEAIETVRARLMVTPQASFRELLSDCEQRIEVVVRFLALLELHREGQVELRQAEVFGEIHVKWHGSTRVDSALPHESTPGGGVAP
jgi:segregation and condensation protein A